MHISAVGEIYDGCIAYVKGHYISNFEISFSVLHINDGMVAGSSQYFYSFFHRNKVLRIAVIYLSYGQQCSAPYTSVHILRCMSKSIYSDSSYRISRFILNLYNFRFEPEYILIHLRHIIAVKDIQISGQQDSFSYS